jgi:hypothetical protein
MPLCRQLHPTARNGRNVETSALLRYPIDTAVAIRGDEQGKAVGQGTA